MSFLREQVKKKKTEKSSVTSASDAATTSHCGSSSSSVSNNKEHKSGIHFDIDPSDTNLGMLDLQAVEARVKGDASTRGAYYKWKEDERYKIGKYASIYGPAAAVRKYKQQFPILNESTVRGFTKRFEEQLKKSTKEKTEMPNMIPKYTAKTGRPLLLGEIDEMVQSYITALSSRGGLINRAIAVSTGKALMERYPKRVGNIDLDSSSWSRSLFQRMGYVRRMKTSTKVDIPDAARKEIEFLFYYNIVSKVEEYNIPPGLIFNLDQTPIRYVTAAKTTLAKRGSSNVTIFGSDDKRTFTATFLINLRGEFLPMQLIYGGKTAQSIPRVKFPTGFSLSANPKHYSNTEESLKVLNDILIPYIQKERSKANLDAHQKALLIMDVFKGQMTPEVKELLKNNDIELEKVPPNMTKYYQPLDLTVNGFSKKHLTGRFAEWYSQQVSLQLAKGINIEDVSVKLLLSILKPLNAGWLIEFYNIMTSTRGKEVILSGWLKSGITDAIKLGLSNLPAIDPFNDIDALLPANERYDLIDAVSNLPEEAFSIPAESDSDESEWEDDEGRSVSGVIPEDFNDD